MKNLLEECSEGMLFPVPTAIVGGYKTSNYRFIIRYRVSLFFQLLIIYKLS
jgi:hypothetical protein